MSSKPKTPKEKKAARRKAIQEQLQEKNPPTTSEDGRVFTSRPTHEADVTTPVKYVQAQPDDADIRQTNQAYMVLSYVAPAEDKSVCKVGAANVMIKISGVFGSESEASNHAAKVHSQSHHRDLISSYVVPLYVWLTIPMPKAAEMYSRKIYADQPILNKLMTGNWQSLEKSRQEVAARVESAKARNMKRLRGIFGEDYVSPQRNPEEVQRDREEMAKQPGPRTEEEKKAEKAYTLMDIYLMFAKYVMKKNKESEAGSSAAEADPGRFDIKGLTTEVREQVKDFQKFVESEVKVLEEQASKLEKEGQK